MNANLHCDANKDVGRLYTLPQSNIPSEVTRCFGILCGRIIISAILLRRVLGILKGKGLPQKAEVTEGVPGRLRPLIFLTFGTSRVVVRQPYAPAAFTPGEIPGTHFYRLGRPQGTCLCR